MNTTLTQEQKDSFTKSMDAIMERHVKEFKDSLDDWFKHPEKYREAHRKEFCDLDWSGQQPRGEQQFFLGDVVEFKVGGIGIIVKVQKPQSGWPWSFACDPVKGHPGHASNKHAWHYELDFARLVKPSALRDL